MKIVDIRYGDSDRIEQSQLAARMLAEHGSKIDYIIGCTGCAPAARLPLQEAGLSETVRIVAYDLTREIAGLIRKRELYAAADTKGVSQARVVTNVAVSHLEGRSKTLPHTILIQLGLADRATTAVTSSIPRFRRKAMRRSCLTGRTSVAKRHRAVPALSFANFPAPGDAEMKTFQLRNMLLLGTFVIGVLAALAYMLAVSWMIRQQHLDQSQAALQGFCQYRRQPGRAQEQTAGGRAPTDHATQSRRHHLVSGAIRAFRPGSRNAVQHLSATGARSQANRQPALQLRVSPSTTPLDI